MSKKIFALIIVIAFIFCLYGCGIKYPELKDNAIAFEMKMLIDVDNDNEEFSTIEYNGRTYGVYGSLEGTLKESDIKECIGYVIQDKKIQELIGSDDKDQRIYTLIEDPDINYLMMFFHNSQDVNKPTFLRAMDTVGKEIYTPKYIGFPVNYWVK